MLRFLSLLFLLGTAAALVLPGAAPVAQQALRAPAPVAFFDLKKM